MYVLPLTASAAKMVQLYFFVVFWTATNVYIYIGPLKINGSASVVHVITLYK